jgi:uncharacterized membrane protein
MSNGKASKPQEHSTVQKIKSLVTKEEDTHPSLKRKPTLGQRAADMMTTHVGSWKFIILLFVFMAIWMALNVYAWVTAWDPYPFILLNFVLSCLAAVQAPIILMSQNRQTERDRVTAKYDYQVNRKAEREIQNMQEDLDKLMTMVSAIHKKEFSAPKGKN